MGPQLSGLNMPERIMDLPQWNMASSTCSRIAIFGTRSLIAICDNRSGSRTICAVPPTRSTSPRFGTTNMTPIRGFCRRLKKPSPRRFPGRSGIARVLSSSTLTKPGGSPLGETSMRPSRSAVLTTMNGERSIQARQ